MNAAAVAAQLELQEQRREFIYSFLVLGMKVGLLAIGAVSVFKLSFAYYQRLDRHGELVTVLNVESSTH